jgi:Protein of unknown function (DUF3617)
MKYAVCVIACAALLAGCHKPQVHETNASVEQVANAVSQSGVANDLYLHAGEWQVTGTVEEMNIPGLPPEAQAQMKKAMGQTQTTNYQYCLTPEEAKKPRGKFFSGKDANNCRYDHFTMGGGKIDAAMTCQGQGPGSMNMAVTGTYSPDSYATHVAMNMQGSPAGSMTMKVRSEAKRIGECTAADEAKARRESGTNG